MARILVVFAHPALEKSRVNVRLAQAARSIAGVTFHDLYEAYPRFDVDVPSEQRLLIDHDAIVVQHPFYWYSVPSLVKEWEDLVLEHGWAYGTGGDALAGKLWLSAITTGGSEATYREGGANRFTIRQLLAPVEQTARLCGMRFVPPFVVHATHVLDEEDIARHARDYARLLQALRDQTVDLDAAERYDRINRRLDEIAPLPGKT